MMIKMEFEKKEIEHGEYKFVLEQDLPSVGWYIYVFKNGSSVFDTLQNTKEQAIETVCEKFSCPKKLWL